MLTTSASAIDYVLFWHGYDIAWGRNQLCRSILSNPSEYGPHTAGEAALVYRTSSQTSNTEPSGELTRVMVLAVKLAKSPISIGGTCSLYVPHLPGYITACDDPEFWRSYCNQITDSEAHTQY
jgi:hypothetical protein